MTPEQLAKSGSEHAHQRALFAWAAKSGIGELSLMFAAGQSKPAAKAREVLTNLAFQLNSVSIDPLPPVGLTIRQLKASGSLDATPVFESFRVILPPQFEATPPDDCA